MNASSETSRPNPPTSQGALAPEAGLAALADASWLAAEDADARIERESGWHWTWGEPAQDERPRQFIAEVVVTEPRHQARLLLAALKGLAGVWLDGSALHRGADTLSGREAVSLNLGPLSVGTHRLAVEVRLCHPFIKGDLHGALAGRLSGQEAGKSWHLALRPGDWRTCTDAPDGWQQAAGPLDDRWQAGKAPVLDPQWQPTRPEPARLLRRDFTLHAAPRRAVLTLTALGACEAEINGERVGTSVLAPEASDHRRRLLAQQHDVTALLRSGANAIGVMVGDGWYASEMLGRGRYPFGTAPRRLIAHLAVTLQDGHHIAITTDDAWRAATAPVRDSEIYNGETYDARLEQPGWSSPGFDDAGWDPVWPAPRPACRIDLQESPPIRATMTLTARRITQLANGIGNGDHIIDFGQNFAGVCRLNVTGEAGRTLTLRHAELLDAEGRVDQRNLRAARATDRYTLRGDAAGEAWSPRFTYHGFRYVQISGWPGELRAADIEGVVLHTDLPVTGHFASDQPLLQALWHNTLWSQRSNFVGLPTDCPQRDERLGWTGDAQIFWPTAAWNMDLRGFTRRFLADLRACQQPGGAYMDTIPPALPIAGAPGWSDAGVVLPHTVWRHYGETTLIDQHWHSMERWMAWIAEANPEGLWQARRAVDFGDWLSLDAVQLTDETTPKLLTATACWARMLGLMAGMARATGRFGRAAHFDSWHHRVATAFRQRFVQPDGSIGNGSHTGYILPLAFGLLGPEQRQPAADRLAADIRRRGTLLSTGFLGTPFSLDALAEHGHADLAVALLLRKDYPGWGYMVSRGATTIWERWNGDSGDVSMNSFNHYALGAVTQFLYRRVAGLDPVEPGFRRMAWRPLLDARLGSGEAWHDSVRGRIASRWQVQPDGRWEAELTLPEGVEAELHLPGHAADRLVAGRHRFSGGAARREVICPLVPH